MVFVRLLVWPDLGLCQFAAPAVLIGMAVAGLLIFTVADVGVVADATALEIGSYLLITLFLALGLMAKSMIVTLPCVFMLLDIWPLGRWQRAFWPPGRKDAGPGRCRRGLGCWWRRFPGSRMVHWATAYITVYGQNKGVALNSFEGLPLGARLLNAVVSCGEYLRQTVWPTGLAPFYAHPAMIPDGWTREFYVKFGIYAVLLAAITGAAIWLLSQAAFSGRRLVLVSGHAHARHRHHPSGHAGPGRPLYVPADDRRVPDGCLAAEGSRRPLAQDARLPWRPLRSWCCWRSAR